MWDLAGSLIKVYSNNEFEVSCLSYSNNGKYLVCGGSKFENY